MIIQVITTKIYSKLLTIYRKFTFGNILPAKKHHVSEQINNRSQNNSAFRIKKLGVDNSNQL